MNALRATAIVFGAALTACTSAPSRCPDGLQGVWRLDGSSPAERLEGEVRLAIEGGEVDLIRTTREGTREILDLPLEDSSVFGDSVFFRFAPIGFVVRGRCETADSVTFTYAVPQPPFDSIRGEGVMIRLGGE